jgi:hypothetical protein
MSRSPQTRIDTIDAIRMDILYAEQRNDGMEISVGIVNQKGIKNH